MKAIVYTRLDHCPFCVKAKELLNSKNVPYEEITVGKDLEKDQFFALFEEQYNTSVSTVPQIILDDAYIGGFTDLESWFVSQESSPSSEDIGDFDITL